MPASRRNTLARIRAAYTGEPIAAAKPGIARDKSIGLDACSSEQKQLRALLALGFLNCWPRPSADAGSSLFVLNCYTITVSPRFERLVLLTQAPSNIVGRLTCSAGLPGLRMQERRGYTTYVLRHLPTDAELIVTSKASGMPTGKDRTSTDPFPTPDIPVTATEQEQLASIPSMTQHAQTLLAGIFCRLDARDPRRQWAIGHWYVDPLRRSNVAQPRRRTFGGRPPVLRGQDNQWTLQWEGYPYPADLAAALTDPVCGVRGTRIVTNGERSGVGLGATFLYLAGFDMSDSK